MNPYAIIPLVSSFFCVIIGTFTYAKNSRNIINKIFLLICFISAYNNIIDFGIRQVLTLQAAEIWKTFNVFWPFPISIGLHLILIYIKKPEIYKNKLYLIIIYLPAFIFSLAGVLTDFVVGAPALEYWGWDFSLPQGNPLLFLFLIWSLLHVIIKVVLFIQYFNNAKNGSTLANKKDKLILAVFLIPGVIGILSKIVLPLLNIKIPLVLNTGFTLSLVPLSIAIWRHNLLELNPNPIVGKILSTMNDSLILFDEYGKVMQTNQSTCTLLKYTEKELIGKTISEIFFSIKSKQGISISTLSKNKDYLEILAKTGSEEYKPFSLSVSNIYLPGNKERLGTVCIARDISERKKKDLQLQDYRTHLEKAIKELNDLNNQLQETDRQKTAFFQNITHEFKTPLTLIMGPLELAGREFESDSNLKELMEISLENAKYLHHLLNQLLDLGKIESKGTLLKTENVELVHFVGRIISYFKLHARQKDISLNFSSSIETLEINVDPLMIEKVLFNLISNSFKFIDKNGRINIEIKTTGKNVLLKIRDNGIGIPEDEINMIFDRFYQAGNRTLNNYRGTGIGLSLAREFINLHNGDISVKSTVGEGTEFIIRLPHSNAGNGNQSGNEMILDQTGTEMDGSISMHNPEKITDLLIRNYQEAQSTNLNHDMVFDQTRNTILFIDDNKDITLFFRAIFVDRYNVYIASNGKEAITLLNEMQKPDIIICDMMMPVMDGKEFHRIINSDDKNRNIPFIFLTAKPNQSEKIEHLRNGAFDYIQKPFSIEELEAKIAGLIEYNHSLSRYLKEQIRREKEHLDSGKLIEHKCNEKNLTQREMEVLELLIQGKSRSDISKILVKIKSKDQNPHEEYISISTTKRHIESIYRKFDVHNRYELYSVLLKNGEYVE